ncbi:MAG: alpha-L-rhamnosidase N-terminal domain-containing protein, partial [Chitinispirillia bacterium]
MHTLHKIHKIAIITLLICTGLAFPVSAAKWTAQWIWQSQDGPANTWLCLRKKVTLSKKPSNAPTRIAAENNYWLYINGRLVVPNGGLDVRPDLNNTYYDSLDISQWLVEGDNIIAVLVWYKGGNNGYSQLMVDKGGFLFETDLSGVSPANIVSDNTWKIRVHPSFEPTKQQKQWGDWKWVSYPVHYDARNDPGDWTLPSYNDEIWTAASQKGVP